MKKTNDFNKYKHAYATWTAARAVQRTFTTTAKISKAIDQSGLREFAEDNRVYSQSEFDNFHRDCASKLINAFAEAGLENVSYGRAAKIIAIYLKTSVIMCNSGECEKSKVIHPPIDRVLLHQLAEKYKDLKGLHDINQDNWTSFEQKDYWGLVDKFNSHQVKFDWTLEKDWVPSEA